LALNNLIVQAPMIAGKDDMKYVLTADWVPLPTELDAEAGAARMDETLCPSATDR
jgi:hypothetical protein